ncbi:uncharacterized protein EMH_0010920 [Eimeria mitis]|uniref:SAG family member n=1 Tax=Eimeria mitis TaxID=44415 RepID=U6K2M1_9EIME|nr:uncharacterized protein EMH_0010920 [Eimeria mitis]CDJ31965.1 hypothetical protein EMH_0010920 [Eimeria mitis]
MAPFYKTAAAFCLVGLFGLQCGAATETKYKFEVVQVKDDAYLTAKLARNGKISAKTNTVEKDSQTVTTLQGKVAAKIDGSDVTCAALIDDTLEKLFHVTFEYTDDPDYRTLVQGALKTGLAEFSNTYPKDTTAWEEMWGKNGVPSLLHLLEASSTKIGCVIGKCVKQTDSPEGAAPTKATLFCELSPAAAKGQAAFSEEYFNELIARKDELSSMTEDDLTSSANVAVPSILTAGLVAILAAISA